MDCMPRADVPFVRICGAWEDVRQILHKNALPSEIFHSGSRALKIYIYPYYSNLIKNEPSVIIRAYDGNEYINHDSDKIMDMGDFLLFLAQ